MGIARDTKKTVKQFSTSTGLDKRRAAGELQRIALVAGGHEAVRGILTSGWEAGSLRTMGGLPMNQFTPLEGVLAVADAVCAQFFPDQWAEYATEDKDRTIRLLQEEHASLAAVPMSSTVDRIAELEQALADLGAEPDMELIKLARDEGW